MQKGSSFKVLVVDDEEMARKFFVSLLSRYGHTCEVAKDGLEALEKVEKNVFDAMLIDIVIPRMDGITLTKKVIELYPDIPVMIMTEYTDEHPIRSAIAAGAREFIKKPFSVDEFMIRFDKMMREKALQALSLTDELTGLYNRRRFFVLMEQCLKVAIRAKKRPLLLFIDMDYLKRINDHYGHAEGDQALIQLAKILKKTFRESDIVARIGGDEFVVLLESPDEHGEIPMTRLHENLREYNAQGPRRYTLSISVGMAQFDPEYPTSIDELLSEADSSMYEQKRKRQIILPSFMT
jgi:two-component system cell cycle response regulator